MIKNKISDDFFKKAILKGKVELFEEFSPAVREFKIGSDCFFEIQKNTEHSRINSRITKFILNKIPLNSSACGFISERSYFDFLRPHIKGYYFLRLDIRKFFHSIPVSEIKALLGQYFSDDKNGMKYSALDIAYMSVSHSVSNIYKDPELRGKEILPMGFPSSPVLSNILFRRIDILIQKLCEDKGIAYTRYADDMLFSCAKSKFLHSEQFEKDISIFISILSLSLKKQKRKESENTISLNGYVIQNKKIEKNIFSAYIEDPTGTIRISDKKLKVIKKLISLLRKKSKSTLIMQSLFKLDKNKFQNRYSKGAGFYDKYSEDQLQNKIKGYRSYLLSLISYNQKFNCVNKRCIDSITEMIKELESYIN